MVRERDKISEILELDANKKYTTYVQDSPLDDCNKTGVPSPWNPNIPDKPHYKDTDHAYDEGSAPCCGAGNTASLPIQITAAEIPNGYKTNIAIGRTPIEL